MPIMLEKSVHVQYVIPMAVSLAFGIIFATVITLFLVPSSYLLQLDFLRGLRRFVEFVLARDLRRQEPESGRGNRANLLQ